MNRTLSRPMMWAILLSLMAAWLTPVSHIALGAPRPATPGGVAPAAAPSAVPSPSPTAEENAEPASTPKPTPSPAVSADSAEGKLNAAVGALSKVQALLEFYFMEAGQYPDTLEDMISQYNQGVKQSDPLVTIPTDPATGKKLLYTPSSDRMKYAVRVPEPAAYGMASLEVHQVDWGWMVGLASEQRRKRMTLRCAQYMQLLGDVIDQYSKANRNKYPDSLDQLMPKYLQKEPMCPLSKKPYVYTHTDRGFEVACPNPKEHGLEYLRFSSTEGLKKFP